MADSKNWHVFTDLDGAFAIVSLPLASQDQAITLAHKYIADGEHVLRIEGPGVIIEADDVIALCVEHRRAPGLAPTQLVARR